MEGESNMPSIAPNILAIFALFAAAIIASVFASSYFAGQIIDERMTDVTEDMAQVQTAIGEVEDDVASAERRFSSVDTAVQELKTTINQKGEDMDDLSAKDKEILNAVNNLEYTVAAARMDLNSIGNVVGDLNTYISENEDDWVRDIYGGGQTIIYQTGGAS